MEEKMNDETQRQKPYKNINLNYEFMAHKDGDDVFLVEYVDLNEGDILPPSPSNKKPKPPKGEEEDKIVEVVVLRNQFTYDPEKYKIRKSVLLRENRKWRGL